MLTLQQSLDMAAGCYIYMVVGIKQNPPFGVTESLSGGSKA